MINRCLTLGETANALTDAKRILNSKKGLFYPDSDYGVASYPLDESEAACLASEALKRADGVFVVAAEKNKNKYEITLIICGEERTVSVEF